jgi:hypothetical protein
LRQLKPHQLKPRQPAVAVLVAVVGYQALAEAAQTLLCSAGLQPRTRTLAVQKKLAVMLVWKRNFAH